MTDPSEDAAAFERMLGASTPEVAEIARALRLTVLEAMPGAIEWFDPGNGLVAIGTKRSMRDLLFAIIPHRARESRWRTAWILPNPNGRIEGTGKRVRHIKARSVDDARSPWLRAAVAGQVAYRGPASG